MPRSLLILIIGLSVSAAVLAAPKTYDYRNLSPSDIEELKSAHEAFYRAEAAGYQAEIRELLQQGMMRIDGNQADFDVRYYGIKVKLDFATSTIEGEVNCKIRSVVDALSHVDLNLHDQLVVDSVQFGGSDASLSHSNHLLSVTTPVSYSANQEFEMTVFYHGTPYYDSNQRGMRFASVSGYPMCYTFCSPFGARYWWPCKDYPLDKPDSVDIVVNYPTAYKVASNGVVVDNIMLGDGRSLIHYKHNYPIATYLVCIACAEFVYGEQNWSYGSYSMPLVTYTLPNAGESKAAYETWVPQVLTHLSDRFGPYPFITEKQGSASFGWGGAMEHQTCIFYLPTFYDSWVIAHENGHQWFGDMISAKTFNHIWLKEGFASYSEALFFESYYDSLSTYLDYMQTQKYLGPGTVYVENLLTDDIFDPNLTYNKGSWVVHQLRGVLGDTTFFRVLREYYDSPYKFNSLTTEDLSAFVSARVGTDMSWFFNEWIYGEGHPDYQTSWICQPGVSGGFDVQLFIWQVQTGGTYFEMPIRSHFTTGAGGVDTVIWNQGREQLCTLHFADSVTDISFDPQEWILRTVTQVPFGVRILSLQPPDGTISRPYNWQLTAAGGTPPYSWARIGGDMPYGLNLNSDGSITGTPTWVASYYYTLKVTDASAPPLTEIRSFVHIIRMLTGDVNGSNSINVSDVVFLISYIFSGGPAPNPMCSGDVDCSSFINISDVVYLMAYVFNGSPEPCAACK